MNPIGMQETGAEHSIELIRALLFVRIMAKIGDNIRLAESHDGNQSDDNAKYCGDIPVYHS